jgi:hypothetical protein
VHAELERHVQRAGRGVHVQYGAPVQALLLLELVSHAERVLCAAEQISLLHCGLHGVLRGFPEGHHYFQVGAARP